MSEISAIENFETSAADIQIQNNTISASASASSLQIPSPSTHDPSFDFNNSKFISPLASRPTNHPVLDMDFKQPQPNTPAFYYNFNPPTNIDDHSIPSPPPTPVSLKNNLENNNNILNNPNNNAFQQALLNQHFFNQQQQQQQHQQQQQRMNNRFMVDPNTAEAYRNQGLLQLPYYMFTPNSPMLMDGTHDSHFLPMPDMRMYQMPNERPAVKHHNPNSPAGRIFKCTKPFCSKIYKNSNGLKYHMDKGSCEMDYNSDENHENTNNSGSLKIAHRPYVCRIAECGKKYKNLNGLKYHAKAAHPGMDFKSEVKMHRIPKKD